MDNNNTTARNYATLSIDSLIEKAPAISEAYDTSTHAYREYLREVINWYDYNNRGYASIDAEAHVGPLVGKELGFCLALKIAESHRILHTITEPVTITLLNPVYKETARMKRRQEHPHGEDSIRFKMASLAHLESLNPMLSCRFFVIDDSCPDASGKAAQAILSQEYDESVTDGKARVYFLADAIKAGDPDLPTGLRTKMVLTEVSRVVLSCLGCA